MTADTLSTLLHPWPGPHGGVPPWDRVDPQDFTSAFEQAIAEAEREIEAIADNPEPPTFDNTVAALERQGRSLQRVRALFGVHASNLNVDPMPDIQRTVGPLLTAHQDRVVQNRALFGRIERVLSAIDRAPHDESTPTDGELTGPARRLVRDLHQHFARQGAHLDPAGKTELSQINQQLTSRFIDFAQNVLADEAGQVTWVEDRSRLAGLAPAVIDALAATAADRGRPEVWAVANTRSAVEPVLTLADDRELRHQVWQRFYSRGQGETDDGAGDGGADNRPIIRDILTLRARRARLVGAASHAHWRLGSEMAKTPEAAMELLLRVWGPAVERARQEVADIEALAGHPIEPWDHRYWAEKARRATYDVDSAEIEPYLQLENLVEAMLWCAGQLHGLRFEPLAATSVPVFHPDVRVWEVTDATGDHIALWYLDPYARPGKLSGAWMTAYRPQSRLDEPITTLVSNNSNFVKPADPDKPILISWDDARTLFHEFGHALHGILSDVTYPSQSGTSVPRDYVEFPSQLNEHWLATPEVLQRFCRHHETGEPMPGELVERIRRAENSTQGFETVEYLAAALYDLRIHLHMGDGTDSATTAPDPLSYERDLMHELGLPAQIVMRHRPTHFAHIFSGDGYSAGYYSYLWADALVADAAEAFAEAGGLFDVEVAERLRRHVLSAGDTVDPVEAFRAFRGRPVDPEALLRKRGFVE